MYYLDVKTLVISGDVRSVKITRLPDSNRLTLPDSPRLDISTHQRSSTLFVIVKANIQGMVVMSNVVAYGDINISNINTSIPSELLEFTIPENVKITWE